MLLALPVAGRQVFCGVCRSAQPAASVYSVRDTGGLLLLGCPACGCLQFEPPPDLDYRHHTDDRRQIEAYVETGAGLEPIFFYLAGVPARPGGARFLDVGAGYGFGVDIARHAFGWDATGVEPSAYGRAGAAALDLPILPGLLTRDGPLAGRVFDVIHASEVVEHVLDPHDFIGLLAGYLAPDGILVLGTPLAAAVTDPAVPEMHKLALLSPGAHARLFSREGLTSLLAAHGLGHVGFNDTTETLVCYVSAVPFTRRDDPVADEAALCRYYAGQMTRYAAVPLLRRAFGNRLYGHLVHHNRIEEAQQLWPQLGVTLPAEVPAAGTPETFHDAVPPSVPYLAYLRGMALLLRGAGDRAIITEAVRLFGLAAALARRKIAIMPHQAMLEASFLWDARLHEAIAWRQIGEEPQAALVARAILADAGDGLVPAPGAAIRARAEALLEPPAAAPATKPPEPPAGDPDPGRPARQQAWQPAGESLKTIARRLRAGARRLLRAAPPPGPRYQGYIDERSTEHIAGWLRDLADPSARLAFEVVLPGADRERILHRGVADRFSPVLRAVGVDDGSHAFNIRFAYPLNQAGRDSVFVRPVGAAWRPELAPDLRTNLADSIFPAPAAPADCPDDPPASPAAGPASASAATAIRDPAAAARWQGFVDERSRWHIAGWALDRLNPTCPPELEIRICGNGTERLLQRLRADEFSEGLFKLKVGTGFHGFFVVFDPPLEAGEEERLVVRIAATPHEIPPAPNQIREFTPINHIALDIVNNCNLRCPFCVYDYTTTKKTEFMSDATFARVLPLVPFIKDANFWLSCLHEPSLHPRFAELIAMVPADYRNKVFFTTNLAKRMTNQQFAFLAGSGLHHINISVESFDKSIYEKMRKGARYEIFIENLENLVAAFSAAASPPKIRFIILPFKSNIDELPSLVERTRSNYMAWQNELRYVYDMTYIDPSFKSEEYIDQADWARIRTDFRSHPADQLVLVDPADAAPPADAGAVVQPRFVPRPLNIRIEHNGYMYVYGRKLDETPEGVGYVTKNYVQTNINDLRNPLKFLLSI
jgi:molybdenum cofactor biosynthesis enzyme MoaA/SAM-dependent methyltransferase